MKKIYCLTTLLFISVFVSTTNAQSIGKLWGMTYFGSDSGGGTIFNYDPVSSKDTVVIALPTGSKSNGYNPLGNVIQATDGNFYGMVQSGGKYGKGVIYRCTPGGKETIIFNFNDTTTGGEPQGSLFQANDGNMYGMTLNGGAANAGTLFKITTAGVFTLLQNFDGVNYNVPIGNLIQGTDGYLYGMTSQGGTSNYGNIFQYNITTNTLTNIHTFTNSDGNGPNGTLLQASDGNFYGTTFFGGTTGDGTVFRCTTTGTVTTLFNFSNDINGSNPAGDLIEATDGNLYGLTGQSWEGGNGTLFRCLIGSGSLTTLVNFHDTNGMHPLGTLIQASDGNLYGMTSAGGGTGDGIIFEYTLSGSLTTLVNLNGANGQKPFGKLLEAMSVNVTSSAGCTGDYIIAGVRGGAQPFSYSWSTGATTSGISVSTAGTYSVTVTDSRGIPASGTLTLAAFTPFSPNVKVTNVSCNGLCNGFAVGSVTGGTPPYSYAWSSGQTTSVADNLCKGSYGVTIKDAIGCNDTIHFNVTQPAVLSVSGSSNNTTCGANNGTATALPAGGTPPYNYSWNTSPVQTGNVATGLNGGGYSVIVTDGNGCTATNSITVNNSSGPVISSPTITPSTCGYSNGKASVTVTGGTAPYKYSWNNGDTVALDSNLAAGTYIVTVTDKNGCSNFEAVTISDGSGPAITVNSVTPISCYGASNGSISVTVSGGAPPYRYSWSNSATTANISGLRAGPYQLTVFDFDTCIAVRTVIITEPGQIIVTPNITQASCGNSDGGVVLNVTGGTSPYTYSWNTGATTSSINNLTAGTYSVTVIDNNGCSYYTQESVSNASGPVVTIDSVVNVSCATGLSSGMVTANASAGTPPYTYSWSTGATTSSISNLSAGNYALTVTDNAGCAGTANASVAVTPPPTISICMVTVDPATNFNNLLWDATYVPKVASYNIYKETTSPGVFNKIGSAAGTNTYVDTLSDARKRSWRYEISQVDSCGNESSLSTPFKTMHLTISPGSGNSVNLIWDNFQGLSFSYYIVYRDSAAGIAKDSIDYVTNSGIFTYTDFPPITTNWYYHMGINTSAGCLPLESRSHSTETINYNSSKSNSGNITFVEPTSLQGLAAVNNIEVSPNPNRGKFNLNLDLSNQQDVNVKIMNTLGQLIEEENYGKLTGKVTEHFDMSQYGKGVYFITVRTNNSVQNCKVVIE
jgi:uncharacterized repeat protein (TIGR03803 family)